MLKVKELLSLFIKGLLEAKRDIKIAQYEENNDTKWIKTKAGHVRDLNKLLPLFY